MIYLIQITNIIVHLQEKSLEINLNKIIEDAEGEEEGEEEVEVVENEEEMAQEIIIKVGVHEEAEGAKVVIQEEAEEAKVVIQEEGKTHKKIEIHEEAENLINQENKLLKSPS